MNFQSFYKVPHTFFLLAAFVLGTLHAIITPPFQTPDEANHFYRAYQVSEGDFVAKKISNRVGGNLPMELYEFSESFHSSRFGKPYNAAKQFAPAAAVSVTSGQRRYYDFNNTALYSGICYVPQAAALLIARALDTNLLKAFYMARFASLLIWLALLYCAIKIIPFGKWALCFFMLFPMVLNINSSISADVVTTSICVFFVAYVFYLKTQQRLLNSKQLLLLLGLALIISQIKSAYVPILLVVLFLSKNNFSSVKKQLTFYGLLSLLAGGAILFWASKVDYLFVSYSNYAPVWRDWCAFGAGSDAKTQWVLISESPALYFQILCHSLLNVPLHHVGSLVARLGLDEIGFQKWFTNGIYLLFILVAIIENNVVVALKWAERLALLAINAIVLAAIITFLYITWMPVGASVVDTFQSRYLFPVYLLLILAISGLFRMPNFRNWPSLIVVPAVVIANAYALFVLYSFYYH